MKKLISVVIPTYNEDGSVKLIAKAIKDLFTHELAEYSYEILFIDNNSTDNTRHLLKEICDEDENVGAIFNAKNFGPLKSPYYGMLQAEGDAVILLCADFQDPIELIPQFVKEWENGYILVIGQKTTSKENKIMRFMRTVYYSMIKKMSEVDQIEQFTGFGLYDRAFIEVLRDLNDPMPYLRGIVAEFGWKRKVIPYEQQKRRSGKSKLSLYNLYDIAMLGFTSYTKVGLRIATFFGFIVAMVCFLLAVGFFVLKLANWNQYSMGTASLGVGLFFLGAVQLIFIGFVGEYILSINQRIMNRPLVIEESRYGRIKNGKTERPKNQ